ncbi:MAG: cellulase family glycosylhydrolase [Planctomycetes bacterium]|nr:cellulase family glycosylhydrolase [Planctomycetota bacterium]
MVRSFFAVLLLLTAAGGASGADKKFPFPVPPFDDSRTVVDMSWMNEKPAGKHGFVTVKDGHFVDGAGKRLRFFATNLCFGAPFPEHADAERVARRMAKLGINCVRFHHMDCHYAPRGIWNKNYKDKQHIDPDQLDKLDYMIYQLKLNGIYADINLHVSRTLGPNDGFPVVSKERAHRYNKALDNFEPRMIELQKKYAHDLLTHTNPYTKTRYVDEPSVAIVEMNNENSLINHALGNRLEPMPDYYGKQLDAMWRDWIKKKYKSTAELRKVWDEVDMPLGPQMLANGDFTRGTEGWSLEIHTPGQAEMKSIPGGPDGRPCFHAKITKPGSVSWSFQFHQVGLDFANGQPYTVTFRAKADKPRTIRVNARLDHAPWTNIGLNQPVKLDKKWKTFTYVFTAKKAAKDGNRLGFSLLNKPSEYWFADVRLQKGGFIGLDKNCSIEKGNITRPLARTSDGMWRDYLAFLIELEKRYTLGMYSYLKGELGLHANVVDTQATYGGLAGVLRESRLDFLDVHAYWQHPRFPGRPWDPNNWFIPNTSMVRAPGKDTLTRLAQFRYAGKPYTVSEYNHPAPNDYAAECVPMLASFAALQDWDGIFLFTYSNGSGKWDQKKISGYFNIDTNPTKIMLMAIGAAMFRRGDVSPAQSEIRLTVPRSQVVPHLLECKTDLSRAWQEAGVERTDAIRRRLSIAFTGLPGAIHAGPVSPVYALLDAFVGIASMPIQLVKGTPAEPEKRFVSDTGEIDWDLREKGAELYSVNSPVTKAAVGFIGGRAVNLGGLRVAVRPTRNNFAVVALTAVDGKPVEKSDRLLLVAISNVENTGMVWDEKRTTVLRRWGKEPTIAEGIQGVVSLACNGRRARVFALDPAGKRKADVPATIEADKLIFHMDPRHETLWYEIAFEAE